MDVMDIANLGMQLGTFGYNARMQQQQWNREDSAYQRAVNDMTASGLNPALIAGSSGSSSTLTGYQTSPQYSMSNEMTKLNAKLVDAQADYYRKLAEGQDIDNTWKEPNYINQYRLDSASVDKVLAEISKTNADTRLIEQEILKAGYDAEQAEFVTRFLTTTGAYPATMSHNVFNSLIQSISGFFVWCQTNLARFFGEDNTLPSWHQISDMLTDDEYDDINGFYQSYRKQCSESGIEPQSLEFWFDNLWTGEGRNKLGKRYDSIVGK